MIITVHVKDALEWKRTKSYISNSLHFSTGPIKIQKKKFQSLQIASLKDLLAKANF